MNDSCLVTLLIVQLAAMLVITSDLVFFGWMIISSQPKTCTHQASCYSSDIWMLSRQILSICFFVSGMLLAVSVE